MSASIKKAINKHDKKISLLYKSTVTFFLLFSLIIGSSYAWFMDDKVSHVTEDYITIAADEGLRMEYGGNKLLSEPIQIHSVANKLSECSSVDGRDIFFPTSDFAGEKALTSDLETEDLIFRCAGANDKNTNYISVDFTLTSDSSTGVWISNESYISGGASVVDTIQASTKSANSFWNYVPIVNWFIDDTSAEDLYSTTSRDVQP